MPAATRNLVAVTPGGAVTDDMIVGDYFWFNVPEEDRPEVTIRKEWRAAGLPEERLPKKRQARHVAQEAVRSVEGDASNGKKRNVVVNQVDSAGTIYQVTLRIWDDENRMIDHEKSMRVTFTPEADKPFTFEALDPSAYEQLRGLEERIVEHFEAHAARLPGHKMRTIVRHLLEGEGAENMSESGRSSVYFIEHEKKPTLDSVAQFLAAVYNGKRGHTRGQLHSVPVVNDEGQREMLKRKFVENCDEDLQKYRDRLLDLVRQAKEGTRSDRAFRTDLLHNLQEQRREMQERVGRFQSILNDELGELDGSLTLADQALAKLFEQAG